MTVVKTSHLSVSDITIFNPQRFSWLSPEDPILYPTAYSCSFYKDFFLSFSERGAGNTTVPQVQGPPWNFSLSNLKRKWKIDSLKKEQRNLAYFVLSYSPRTSYFKNSHLSTLLFFFQAKESNVLGKETSQVETYHLGFWKSAIASSLREKTCKLCFIKAEWSNCVHKITAEGNIVELTWRKGALLPMLGKTNSLGSVCFPHNTQKRYFLDQ